MAKSRKTDRNELRIVHPENEKKDEQNDPPRFDVGKRPVIVVGFWHGARDGPAREFAHALDGNRERSAIQKLSRTAPFALENAPGIRVTLVPPCKDACALVTRDWRLLKYGYCRLTSQDDVFFCPGVDFPQCAQVNLLFLTLAVGPQRFFDCLSGRRQFRGRRTSHQDAFNDWPNVFLLALLLKKFISLFL